MRKTVHTTEDPDLLLPLFMEVPAVRVLLALLTLALCLVASFFFVFFVDLSGSHTPLWIVLGISWYWALMR